MTLVFPETDCNTSLTVRAGPITLQRGAVAVAPRQWIAGLAVAEGKPAFKIQRPDLIGQHRLGEAGIECIIDFGCAAARHILLVTSQNSSDGAPRRWRLNLGLIG